MQPEARARIIARISWLTGRGQQSDSYTYLSSSYASFARARESFELCSHFKSLPPVSDRELSADLTWRAHRRKPEFPALGLGTQSTCVQGERGVKMDACGRARCVRANRTDPPGRPSTDPDYACMSMCLGVGRARRISGRGGALMAIMALLRPGGTDQGLGGDSGGINGPYELG